MCFNGICEYNNKYDSCIYFIPNKIKFYDKKNTIIIYNSNKTLKWTVPISSLIIQKIL